MAVFPSSLSLNNQPLNAPLFIKAEYANLIDYFAIPSIGIFAKNFVRPTLTGSYGIASSQAGRVFLLNGSSDEIDIGGSSGAYSSGVSIVVQAYRSSASSIQTVVARAAGNTAGGFEITLYNLFGGPSNRIYSSYYNGVAQVNFDAGYVNGISDSLNGTYNTDTDRVYTIGASINSLAVCGSNIKIGKASGGAYYLQGGVSLLVVFNRRLPNAILQELTKNPWQIFEDPFASFFYTASGGGVSGSLAATLANATLAAAGNVSILGTLAQTLANTTSTIAGTTTVLGALSLNLAATTLAASGSVGSPVSGTITETLDNTTLSAAGTTTIVGTVAQTLANVTSVGSGTTTVLGSAAITLGNDTLAASGAVGGAVSGSVSLTLANATLAAAGTVTILGTVNYTTENTVSSAAGTTQILGTLGVTLANTTLVATGTSGTVTAGAAWRFLKLWISKLGF